MDGPVGAVIFLAGYLIAASFMVAMIVEGTEGTIIDPIIIGGYSISESNETDFTQYMNISELNLVVTDGGWNLSSLTGLSSQRSGRNAVFFLNTDHAEGWYNNTYSFKNPLGLEHGIYIYYQHLLNSVYVIVTEDGFLFKDGFTERFYSYPDADQIPEYNFTTNFNTDTEWCTVYFEDTEIFNRPASISLFTGLWDYFGVTNYYSGVYAFEPGFEIHDLNSLFIFNADESDFSIRSLLNTMAIVLFWVPPDYVMQPVINVLFIKIPGLGLAFIIIQLIRGAG